MSDDLDSANSVSRIKHEMNANRIKLQSAKAHNARSSFLQQDAECDFMTEELCIDENDNLFCTPLEMGCPCNDGQVKCGAIQGVWAGYCTPLCCKDNEETCYNDAFYPTKCEAVSLGGCPCPEGQTKCGDILEANYPGFCMDICCAEDEDWCVGDMGSLSCAAMAEGGCPSNSDTKSLMPRAFSV